MQAETKVRRVLAQNQAKTRVFFIPPQQQSVMNVILYFFNFFCRSVGAEIKSYRILCDNIS
jgi:hypothetical protein